MKIHVDWDRCTGNGLCEGIDEDVFEVGEDGVVHLLQESPAEDHRDKLRAAVEQCPTEALSLED